MTEGAVPSAQVCEGRRLHIFTSKKWVQEEEGEGGGGEEEEQEKIVMMEQLVCLLAWVPWLPHSIDFKTTHSMYFLKSIALLITSQ